MEVNQGSIDALAQWIPKVKVLQYPVVWVEFIEFYGVYGEGNPNIHINETDDGVRYDGRYIVEEYDEWVKLVEAAADMLMYYLPHIGTVEDFTQFMQAHYAGETNFAELTLPDTNPAKRMFHRREKEQATS